MKVAIGSDHIAVDLKASLIEHLKDRYDIVDAGTDSGVEGSVANSFTETNH